MFWSIDSLFETYWNEKCDNIAGFILKNIQICVFIILRQPLIPNWSALKFIIIIHRWFIWITVSECNKYRCLFQISSSNTVNPRSFSCNDLSAKSVKNWTLIFQISSILLMIVGGTIRTIYNDFSHFLEDHFISVPTFMVVIGFFMLFVALFGVFGAFKESTMLTNIVSLQVANPIL